MKKIAIALTFVLCAAAPAAAQFGKNKIAYDKFDWKVYRSTHFTVYFYPSEQVSLPKVTSYAESAYDEISRALNFQIPKPINLIYYASHSDFEQTNTLLNFIPEGIGAFALPSRNRMVLPVDLPDEKLQQLIAHELTHVFQFEILFGGNYIRAATTNAPQWFTEGMASYFGNDEDNKDRMVLRDAVLADQVPEIAQTGAIGGFFAYRFGHAVFDFIEAEWGKDSVRDFVFEFRNQIGGNVEKVIKRAFNLSAEDFDVKFRRYLRQRYLKILAEKGEPIDFGERFKLVEEPSAELMPRAYPSGDFVAAISTLKNDADVVVLSTVGRKLYRNLTRGYTTKYEYIVAQWLTTASVGGGDVAVSPDGNTVAVFARRERGRELLLLNALDGGIRERVEMPDLDQQLNPAFSPDGNTVVFRALKGGRADIWAYSLSSRNVTNLTGDDVFDFGPTYSSDGKWIYYSSVRGTKAKIFRFDPASPGSRQQITYGDWNDEDAALSPDGKRLFFTSDRDGGIYNIYSINLETGETNLHTNVVAGAFSPTVFIGKDNTEKLVFSAYYKRRFTLYIADSKKTVRRLPELAPAVSPAGPESEAPFQPAIEVSIDPEKIRPRASHKLQLEDAQVVAGVNTDQTFVSNTILIFGDNLGDRRLIAQFQSLSSFTNFNFIYFNLKSRLQKGFALFDDRTFFLGFDQSRGVLERGRRIYRQTGALALASYPLSRYYRVDGQLGYISRKFDFPFVIQNRDGTQAFFVSSRSDNYPTAGVSFVGDTVLYEDFGPLSGRRFAVSYSYAPDFKKADDPFTPEVENSSTLSSDVALDLRRYIKVSRRSLLAIRLYGAHSTGNFPNVYYFGGLDTLRGLRFREQIGNTIGYANFEYRFPLIDILATPILAFRDIRGQIFLDVGGAALKDETFRFWDSKERRLVNGRSSYGFGFQVDLLGLQLHWDFAKLWDFKQTQSGLKTSFYIGAQF
ncbi:MAG TPA: BamA/TamA family outer membrane protein [Thermoanaerobaculia bacterium]|jgi:Tol biopolymer transport system component|nr:BamA/TamA family outer membrane protein [Thermoanaerobaculia bacterium]